MSAKIGVAMAGSRRPIDIIWTSRFTSFGCLATARFVLCGQPMLEGAPLRPPFTLPERVGAPSHLFFLVLDHDQPLQWRVPPRAAPKSSRRLDGRSASID